MGEYVELLVYLLILLLPVIGRALSTMGRGEQAEKPTAEPRPKPTPRPRRSQTEVDGAERWKELLRGEAEPVVEDPLPPARQVAVEPPRPAPRPEPEPEPFDPLPAPARPPAPAPVRPAAPAPVAAATSRVPAVRVAALGADFVSDLGAGLQDLKTELATSLAVGEVLPGDEAGEGADLSGSLAFPPRSSADWRRAVVLQEVLGPPLALRESARPGDLPSFTLV